MKAYKAWVEYGEGSTVVFAETRNEAKMIAQSCDCCEDARYIDIQVRRLPEADKLYKGLAEIDWYDPETRVSLVRDFGWSCYDPSWECDNCQAKPYCHWHEQEEDTDG